MTFVTWTPAYVLGVPEMDEMHRNLFLALQRLHEGFVTGRHPSDTDEVVRFMETYSKIHFELEERLMGEFPHPEVEEHLSRHREFEAQVAEYLQRTGFEDRLLAMQVLAFLRDWLVKHIGLEDRVLAEAVKVGRAQR